MWFTIDLSNEVFTCIFYKLFTLSSDSVSDGSTDEWLLWLHPKFKKKLYLRDPSRDIEWTVMNMKKDNDYQQNMKKDNDYQHTMSPIKQD